jgi:hypothetical protein
VTKDSSQSPRRGDAASFEIGVLRGRRMALSAMFGMVSHDGTTPQPAMSEIKPIARIVGEGCAGPP